MLKTFTIALLALAIPVGLAHAHGKAHHMHRHMIPGCAMGQPAAATCAFAVPQLITVRYFVTRGNGATPRKRARCERTHSKLG